jgi:hypothetical protein
VKIADNQTFRHADSLGNLPIDVAEAMYSPDFVELSSLSPGGTPLSLPMSFTLDIAGNCVRFSSPLTAGRLANYARDPRCSVLFSRVTTGHPPVLLQGAVTVGDVAEGVRRGPARRFTVTPERLFVLGDDVEAWLLPPVAQPQAGSGPSSATARPQPPAAVTDDDLAVLIRQPSTIVTLRDAAGRPVALPVDLHRRDSTLIADLPDLGDDAPVPGRASVLGHTWTKEGPRYIALTGRATLDGPTMTFEPARTMRRGL